MSTSTRRTLWRPRRRQAGTKRRQRYVHIAYSKGASLEIENGKLTSKIRKQRKASKT